MCGCMSGRKGGGNVCGRRALRSLKMWQYSAESGLASSAMLKKTGIETHTCLCVF